ncbi:MAG: anti-sigma factor antagonist [Planctomycetota bacterium]|nr:MAG: anti-sigma factor antagonist [Planctomycetota bacterium]
MVRGLNRRVAGDVSETRQDYQNADRLLVTARGHRADASGMPTPVLQIEDAPTARIVTFAESATFDAANAPAFGRQFEGLLTSGGDPIIIDLRNVGHLGSAALGELLMFHRQADELGVRVVLCNASPSIRRVFEVTRLIERFAIEPTRDAALARLSSEAESSA